MIQYGGEDHFNIVREGYIKNGSSFLVPTSSGTYGRLGENAVDGYYVAYCAGGTSCEQNGRDVLNFTTNGTWPYWQSVPCGFSIIGGGAQSTSWESCPDGDNEQRMK